MIKKNVLPLQRKNKEIKRGVAQLVACYVRDVEVKSSSLFTPTR